MRTMEQVIALVWTMDVRREADIGEWMFGGKLTLGNGWKIVHTFQFTPLKKCNF